VEKLAQQGCSTSVSGTTRSGWASTSHPHVLLTQLFKFDGEKLGLLSVREFRQIAGGGAQGFDVRGLRGRASA